MTFVYSAGEEFIGMYDSRMGQEELRVLATTLPEYFARCRGIRQHSPTVQLLSHEKSPDYPLSAVQHGSVSTVYVPTFRVHPKKYFSVATSYPETWNAVEAKINATQRFSPAGTLGYYFGLTLDAALDESHYYQDGPPSEKDYMLMVVESYFDNVLFLTPPVLLAAWQCAGLEQISLVDMYLRIMDAETGNRWADRLGLWAREHGLSGLIYPSARYGQRAALEDARRAGKLVVPIFNIVNLGTRLCRTGVAASSFSMFVLDYVKENFQRASRGIFKVYSEPNLVLFDNGQITGADRAVFYRTFPLRMEDQVRSLDARAESKNYTDVVIEEDKVTIVQNGPDFASTLE